MKTFEEHKTRTKTFIEHLRENDSSLVKDLEKLGVNDETFNIEDIKEAWDDVISEPIFADENYIDVNTTEEFEVSTDESSGSVEVEVKFTGVIEINSVDSAAIVKDITDQLRRNDDDDSGPRWTMEQITEALEAVAWEDYIILNFDDAEAEVTQVHYSGSSATVEYGLKDEAYFVTATPDDMWSDFASELGI